MILSELIEKLDDSAYIKVGCVDGGKFIFAGSVGDFKASLEKLNQRYYNNREKAYLDAKAQYDAVMQRVKDGYDVTEVAIKRAIRGVEKTKKTCDKYVPLPDREIKEVLRAAKIIDDVPGVALVFIEGTEYGDVDKINKHGKGVLMR